MGAAGAVSRIVYSEVSVESESACHGGRQEGPLFAQSYELTGTISGKKEEIPIEAPLSVTLTDVGRRRLDTVLRPLQLLVTMSAAAPE